MVGTLTGSALPGASADRGAIVLSASIDLLPSGYVAATGQVTEASFATSIPFLSIQGADSTGEIKDFKIQVSGGMLQVTEYAASGVA